MEKNALFRAFKLLLAALVTASLLCNLQILWGKKTYIGKGYFDFVIYYTGAEIIDAGRGGELYNLDVQEAYQERFKVPYQPWSVLPFNHAPYELLLFLPLTAFSFQAAHIIWSASSIIFLFFAWWLLGRAIDDQHRYFSAALLLVFYPTMTTLQMGQDSTLSLLILTGVLAGLKRRQEFLAGGILALGLYKPQLVLPLAGILGVGGYRRTMVGFASTAAVLIVISLAMVGWQGAIGLFKIVSAMDGPTSIVYPESMTNLRGLSFLILDLVGLRAVTNSVTVLASAIVYVCCLWMWKREDKERSLMFDLQYSLAIVATVLVSFHLYAHDAIILVIPVIILLNHVLKDSAQTNFVRLGTLASVLILYTPFVPFFLTIRGDFAWGVSPIVLMFVVIVCEVIRVTASQSVQRSIPQYVESRAYNEGA